MARPITAVDHTCGVRIAGIGPAPGLNIATTWAYLGSQRLITALDLAGEGWIADCLVELPQTVERSVEPWSSRYTTGPMGFELDLERVGHQIPVQAWEPATNLAATCLESATTIDLTSDALAARLLYVNGETIYTTSPVDQGGGVWRYTATRAYNGSASEEHGSGDPAYLAPPSWRGRKVEFLVIDGAGGGRIRWTGYLSEIRTGGTGTRVVIEGREILDALTARQINIGAPDLAAAGGVVVDRLTGLLAGAVTHQRRVRKRSIGNERICFQVGDGLITMPYLGGDLEFDLATFELGTVYGKEIKRTTAGDDPARFEALDSPVFEMFVVSPALDAKYGGGVSATWDLGPELRYHPVAIAWSLLSATSSFAPVVDIFEPDVLTPAWGVGLFEWLDVERWYSVIATTPEVVIDQLYLGWDGKAVDLLDTVIDVLLRPYGFFLAISEDGRLGVSRLISPTIKDLCEAGARQVPLVRPSSGGQLEWSYEISTAVGQVTANVGATPWQPEPSTLTISASSRTPRGAEFVDSRVYTYDLQTVARSRVAGYADGDAGDGITAQLIDKTIRASWALPRLKITALDSRTLSGTVRYDLGSYVTLGAVPPAPIFRLPDGSLADLSDPEDQVYFLGQILGARQNVPNQTYELELLLVAWRTGKVARFRAPSGIVDGWSSGSGEAELVTSSEFGSLTQDVDGFAVGDELAFVDLDGAPDLSSTPVITDIVGGVITISGVVDSPAGMVMRLADASVYANTGNAVGVTCTPRPWVYLADAADQITTTEGIEDADSYG